MNNLPSSDENILEEKTPSLKKKENGKKKSIYFSHIQLKEYTQKSFFNEDKVVTVKNCLAKTFENINNGQSFHYKFDDNSYYDITLHQHDDKYYLFSLSQIKNYSDILSEPVSAKTKKSYTKEELMLRFYTFILVDLHKKRIAYLGNRNLKDINTILTKLFLEKSKIPIDIYPFKRPDMGGAIEKAIKTQSLDFVLNNSLNDNISRTLDQTLGIDRETEVYTIKITIRKPRKSLIRSLLNSSKNAVYTKPKLSFINEDNRSECINLITSEFTICTSISIKDIDLKENEKIKEKLILALHDLDGCAS